MPLDHMIVDSISFTLILGPMQCIYISNTPCVDSLMQVSFVDSLNMLFKNMEWGPESISWDEEADLRDVIRYARGSSKLRIPDGWREVLPTTIPP